MNWRLFLDTGQVFNSLATSASRITDDARAFRAIDAAKCGRSVDYGYRPEGGAILRVWTSLLDAFNAVSERPGLLMRHISYLVCCSQSVLVCRLTVGAEGLVHFRSEIFRRWINWSWQCPVTGRRYWKKGISTSGFEVVTASDCPAPRRNANDDEV